jgi:hypothetical protein
MKGPVFREQTTAFEASHYNSLIFGEHLTRGFLQYAIPISGYAYLNFRFLEIEN